jgi:ATP-dependent NAD(P)H-hydrate dehydratase
VHIICEPEAGRVIKTYSPDLIVHPILSKEGCVIKFNHNSSANNNFRSSSLCLGSPASIFRDKEGIHSELTSILSRLHAIVIGPGLGRQEHMQEFARRAISLGREQDKYIVLDADGLWLIEKHPEYIRGYNKAVLTPNVVEFGRLRDTLVRSSVRQITNRR